MEIEIDEGRIEARLRAPLGGAGIRITDGDQVLYDGAVNGQLKVEFDADAWGIPLAMQDLLGVELPGLDRFNPEQFKPLATPYIGLATCRVTESPPRGLWTPPAILPGQMLPLSVMARRRRALLAVLATAPSPSTLLTSPSWTMPR